MKSPTGISPVPIFRSDLRFQKLGVGVLKNKQQLIHALEKAAGQELAEKAKQEVAKAARQKTKVFIEEQVGRVNCPAGEVDITSS